MQNLTSQQKALLEEELIDTLIAWKKKTDAMAGDIAAARDAMAKAKKFRIWEGKYPGFREWLENECGISQSWAYGLISAAKTIEAIEDASPAIVESGDAKPEEVEQVTRAVRALPTRTLQKLGKLKPLKALKVVSEEVKKANGEELVNRLQESISKQIREGTISVAPVNKREEVLAAVDAEWASLRKGMAYVPVTPESVFLAIKRVLEKML